jgi:hypothetical protein
MSEIPKFDVNESINTIKNAGNAALNNVTEYFKTNNDYMYIILSLTIVFLILFLLLSWINYTLNLKQKGCNNLNTIYPENNPYRTKTFIKGRVNFENPNLNITVNNNNYPQNHLQKFKNYYVKASYNSCCADGYKNNWVDLCALTKNIQLGVRFLDFEVYSLNFQPIVAASTANNYNIKETYNYLYLSDVFEDLYNNAFNEEITQSYNDPMIIHLRLMTENTEIYNLIAGYINSHLNKSKNYLLDSRKTIGHNDFDPKEIINAKLELFAKKFIIIAYQSDSVLKSSNLKDFVNLRSGSNYCRLLRYQSIISAGESSELLINETKNNYMIVLPDVNNSLENYDYTLPLSNGCQIMAMKFQNMDSNLTLYNDYFSFNQGNGYNFVLKPSNLLYDVVDNIRVKESEVTLETPGLPGTILIYNNTNHEIIKYELFKTIPTPTDRPKLENYINRKTSNNNHSERINLTKDVASSDYYIRFSIYGSNNARLTNADIQILATGTKNSATKALFNKYPLETVANTNDLFKITPHDRDNVANITLNVN